MSLYYNDAAHAHAVSSTSTNNAYAYDENGSMKTKVIGADTYAFAYDAENRMVEVKKTTGGVTTTIASFVYDGDGARVQSTVNGQLTTFVGGYYEVQGSDITKYYFAGAERVAVRKDGVLTYLAGDHLGSTSLVTDASGALITKTLYKPWGEVRYNTPNTTLSTRYTYTGQYSYISDDATDLGSNGFGLMYYGARMYDPALGRFSSADTIVPGVGTSQAWDRYAYGMNNPLRYIDPSGHDPVCVYYEHGECAEYEDAVADPVQELIDQGDLQGAIDQALISYGIDTYGVRPVVGNIFPEGQTTQDPDTGQIMLVISIATVRSGAANLASTIYHESIHVTQYLA
jgi:RHS repeat-associated protein